MEVFFSVLIGGKCLFWGLTLTEEKNLFRFETEKIVLSLSFKYYGSVTSFELIIRVSGDGIVRVFCFK